MVEAFVSATSHLSLREAETATGLNYGTIAKFRRGTWKTIFPVTVRQMRTYLAGLETREEETPEDALHDPGEVPDDRPGVGEEELIRMPQVVRFLKRYDGRPDELELKRAALTLWGQILAMEGPWPDWFIVLRGKVERGEF